MCVLQTAAAVNCDCHIYTSIIGYKHPVVCSIFFILASSRKEQRYQWQSQKSMCECISPYYKISIFQSISHRMWCKSSMTILPTNAINKTRKKIISFHLTKLFLLWLCMCVISNEFSENAQSYKIDKSECVSNLNRHCALFRNGFQAASLSFFNKYFLCGHYL